MNEDEMKQIIGIALKDLLGTAKIIAFTDVVHFLGKEGVLTLDLALIERMHQHLLLSAPEKKDLVNESMNRAKKDLGIQ